MRLCSGSRGWLCACTPPLEIEPGGGGRRAVCSYTGDSPGWFQGPGSFQKAAQAETKESQGNWKSERGFHVPRATQQTEPGPHIQTEQVTPSLGLSSLLCPAGRGPPRSCSPHPSSLQTLTPLVPTICPCSSRYLRGPRSCGSRAGPTLLGGTRWSCHPAGT